jgi:hypothetical protein
MPTGRHMGHRAPASPTKPAWRVPSERRRTLGPVIAELQAAGITSLNAIADALNERNTPTPGGSGRWHAMQVSRLLKRLAE